MRATNILKSVKATVSQSHHYNSSKNGNNNNNNNNNKLSKNFDENLHRNLVTPRIAMGSSDLDTI